MAGADMVVAVMATAAGIAMAGTAAVIATAGTAADIAAAGAAVMDITAMGDMGDTEVLIILVIIPIGMGIIITPIEDAAGCRDIGNMVIGFPVIIRLAIKKIGNEGRSFLGIGGDGVEGRSILSTFPQIPWLLFPFPILFPHFYDRGFPGSFNSSSSKIFIPQVLIPKYNLINGRS